MIIVNRFLQIAERFGNTKIELEKVFQDAQAHEVDHVLKALYVIADKRMDMGDPVQLEEIAKSIPELIEDESVLEAAVEISIDGLIATGRESQRRTEDLEEQLRLLARTEIMRQDDDSASQDPDRAQSNSQRGAQLPREFGPKDLDGRPRYELRRVLGAGNQGVMYEAIDRLFSDEFEPVYVAVKIFHEVDEAERFSTEGIAARKVRHPNVAAVVDHGKSESGEVFVAYELIRGTPLDDWVKRHPGLRNQEQIRLVIEIAKGVQAAHAAGIVHRDIKPGNIIVDDSGKPVITDFGIASTKHQLPSLSGRYGTRGSLAFMAPEQFRGEMQDAPLVDVYAIGGLLYWMVTTSFPNGDRVGEAIGWLDEREAGGPSRNALSIHHPTVRAILLKALALDPSERYQSAEALAHDLVCMLQHRPVAGVEEGRWTRASLFLRRNRYAVAIYIFFVIAVSMLFALIVRQQFDRQLARESIAHVQEVERLNHQIEMEVLKSDQLTERMLMAREMVASWVKTLDAEATETAVLFNLLFLHSQSLNGPLVEDPAFLSDLLERRVEVAIEYAESIDPDQSSPIERALWFEMIAGWLEHTQPERAGVYKQRAAALVERYAPHDEIWLLSLQSSGSAHASE